MASGFIELPEYMFAVTADRAGAGSYSTAQLKSGHDAITHIPFSLVFHFYLGEAMKYYALLEFVMIVARTGRIFFSKQKSRKSRTRDLEQLIAVPSVIVAWISKGSSHVHDAISDGRGRPGPDVRRRDGPIGRARRLDLARRRRARRS
nr:DMT family protein [Caulobacter sp. B11]